MPKGVAPRVRPTKWTRAKWDEIMERIRGGESVAKICASSLEMPAYSTFWIWAGDPESEAAQRYEVPLGCRDEYQRARAARAEHLVEEMFDIADGMDEAIRRERERVIDEMGSDADPKELRRAIFAAKHRSVEAAKEQIKLRRWAVGRMAPKQWGDRITHEIVGDPERPVQVNLSDVSEEHLEKIAQLEHELAVAKGEVVDITPEPKQVSNG